MADPFPISVPFRVSSLGARQTTAFDIRPSAFERAEIAAYLGISGLDGLRFSGELHPHGKRDYALEGTLEAIFVQPCVVSLVPVRTKVDEPVRRTFVADLMPPEGDDVEMPEDDSIEPLPSVIDAGAVMLEALLIALPEYPKAPGAELGEMVLAPPGAAPLRDSDLRPFAGLATLVDRLGDGEAKAPGDAAPDEPARPAPEPKD